MPKINSNLCCL